MLAFLCTTNPGKPPSARCSSVPSTLYRMTGLEVFERLALIHSPPQMVGLLFSCLFLYFLLFFSNAPITNKSFVDLFLVLTTHFKGSTSKDKHKHYCWLFSRDHSSLPWKRSQHALLHDAYPLRYYQCDRTSLQQSCWLGWCVLKRVPILKYSWWVFSSSLEFSLWSTSGCLLPLVHQNVLWFQVWWMHANLGSQRSPTTFRWWAYQCHATCHPHDHHYHHLINALSSQLSVSPKYLSLG